MTGQAPQKPLDGIKIVEFSTMITASLAAMTLADQGATVIKIEPKDIGDPMRYLGTQKAGISALFANCNRGKRSMALDIKTDAGLNAARRLCLEADIVIHNYRPGVMDRIGLGSEDLRNENPKLIVIAISGFGTVGPLSGAPAYDPIVQAFSGLTDMQGWGEDHAYVRQTVCDKLTAYTAAQAASTALFARERTGAGQHIDLSMLDSSLYFTWPDGMMTETLLDDDVDHQPPFSNIYRLLPTSDGYVSFAAGTDEQWQMIFDLIGRPELKTDPRFTDMMARGRNNRALMEEACGTPVDKTSNEIVAQLSDYDIPCAPTVNARDVPDNAQVQAAGSVAHVNHPMMGNMRFAAPPAQFGGERLTPADPCPALGQHTDEILAELGLSETDIAAMRDNGAI